MADATTTVQSTSSGDVVATESDNGREVVVPLGAALVVRLGNTYWRFAPAADESVLERDGTETFTTVPPASCIPGGGCGEVSQRYVARAAGHTTVTATRTTCGEALPCPPDKTTFTIGVTVT